MTTTGNFLINSLVLEVQSPSVSCVLYALQEKFAKEHLFPEQYKTSLFEYVGASRQRDPALWELAGQQLSGINEVLIPMWQIWWLDTKYPDKVKRVEVTVSADRHSKYYRLELKRRLIHFFRHKKHYWVGKGTMGDIEVYVPADGSQSNLYRTYDRYVLRICYQSQSAGWELHVTYAGETRLSKRPIDQFPNLPDKGYRVMYDCEVWPIGKLGAWCRSSPHLIYPFTNREIAPIVGFKPPYRRDMNKLATQRDRIDRFLTQVIMQSDFEQFVGVKATTGQWLPVYEDDVIQLDPQSRLLEYQDGQTGMDPVHDLPRYGPYQLPPKPVKFILIYQQGVDGKQPPALTKLLSLLTTGHTSLSRYIGLSFCCPDGLAIPFRKPSTAVEEVQRRLRSFHEDPEVIYEAFYLSPVPKGNAQKKEQQVYYRLKEMLMERGIMLQTLYAGHLNDTNFSFFLPNLSLAMFAKAGGIPFVFHRPCGEQDLIIGVGAYLTLSQGTRYVGSAICFDSRGVLKGYNCWPDSDIERLAASICRGLSDYIRQYGQHPKRIVIHYYKTMSRREARPITRFLESLNIRNIPVYVLHISKSESEDLIGFCEAEPDFMPVSGTVIRLGRGNYLLYNNERYVPHAKAGVVTPVRVRIYRINEKGRTMEYNDEDARDLLTQVYQFSRLNYKTVKQHNLPVTTLYPELAARVVPFFEGKAIPEAAQHSLGFL